MMKTLVERAHDLQSEGVFLGGPLRLFEVAGRKTLATLQAQGLRPESMVLDIGCGCLRIGYWLIHFLEKGRYFGIEPNVTMLAAGVRLLLEPGVVEEKLPRFSHNDNFDFSVFAEHFDYYVARSIWTHASKPQILAMMDSFNLTRSPHAVFITSYLKPALFRRDYAGTNWVGRSHQSTIPGLVAHDLRWIKSEAAKMGLDASELPDRHLNFGGQKWLCLRAAALSAGPMGTQVRGRA